MAKKRKQSAEEKARAVQLEKVVEEGEEWCHNSAPRDWSERVLDYLGEQGLEVNAFNVHGALQEKGWYCDPDDTEDD